MMRRVLVLTLMSALLACGQEHTGGPAKAYLILQRPDGTRAEFALGGYPTLRQCSEVVTYEITASERDHDGMFGTNSDFTYGGVPQEGWDNNRVLGGRCEFEE
jgi:hypothetical protein